MISHGTGPIELGLALPVMCVISSLSTETQLLFGDEPSERLLSSAPSRHGEGIAKRCRRDPSRRDAVGGKPWEGGNVAKDLRSTAESKLDVLFAVWLGKKSTAAGFPGWRGHT